MSFFRRKHQDSKAHVPEEGSYEEAEENPELLAAEQAVDEMPYSVHLMNPTSNEPVFERAQPEEGPEDQGPPHGKP
jgi:hypothetical protein